MFPIGSAAFSRSIVQDRHREAEMYRRARRAKKAAPKPPAVPTQPPALGSLGGLAHTSPAVRIGDVVEVGAVAATGADGSVMHLGDPYEQAVGALRSLERSLRAEGAELTDVVRTRVYLKRPWQWEEAGRAHGEIFGATRPATTFLGVGGFVDPGVLVAVEATAVVR